MINWANASVPCRVVTITLLPALMSTGCLSELPSTENTKLTQMVGTSLPPGAQARAVCTDPQGGGLATARAYFVVEFRSSTEADAWLLSSGFAKSEVSVTVAAGWREASLEERSSRARCAWHPPTDAPLPVVYHEDHVGQMDGVYAMIIGRTVWARGWLAQT